MNFAIVMQQSIDHHDAKTYVGCHHDEMRRDGLHSPSRLESQSHRIARRSATCEFAVPTLERDNVRHSDFPY